LHPIGGKRCAAAAGDRRVHDPTAHVIAPLTHQRTIAPDSHQQASAPAAKAMAAMIGTFNSCPRYWNARTRRPG
jgi:hypothetical protein